MPSPIEPLFGSSGPLSKLESNNFGYTELKYPSDLGQDKGSRYPYHMKFYINVAALSSYQQKPEFAEIPQSSMSIRPVSKDLKPSFYSSIFRRKTYRSKQAILLYMPDTLNWSFGQNWKDAELTEQWGKVGQAAELIKQMGQGSATLMSAASSLLQGKGDEAQKTMNAGKALTNTTGLASEKLAELIGKDPALGVAAVGLAQNPNVEVLYQQPNLRSFQFEFVFAPRNRRDADNAISIIQLFKFHSAPENFTESGGAGRYFVPPSDFDIEFHGPSGELWQFGKIIPNAVLKNITVNYGQSGQFAALPGDYPTSIQLMLEFQETHFITKGLVERGY